MYRYWTYVRKALLILWAAPVTLLGLLYMLTLLPSRFRIHRGTLEVQVRYFWPFNFAIAQTLGHLIMYKPGCYGNPEVRGHERVHTHQAEMFGWAILLLYPLATVWALLHGEHYYRCNLFEVWARKEAGRW